MIVYNEDCFKTMSGMAEDEVDVVFTSPPYNRKRNDKYTHYHDDIKDYYGFLEKLVQESLRVSKRNVFINIQKNYYNKHDVFKIIGEFSDQLTEIFVWEKSNPMPSPGAQITNAYEFILVFGDTLKSNNTYTKNHITTSVASMPEDHKAVMHPKVSDYFVGNFTTTGDSVYDPFMGTGTTARSCSKFNVGCIGSEISEEYFNKYLSGDAVLEGDQ